MPDKINLSREGLNSDFKIICNTASRLNIQVFFKSEQYNMLNHTKHFIIFNVYANVTKVTFLLNRKALTPIDLQS